MREAPTPRHPRVLLRPRRRCPRSGQPPLVPGFWTPVALPAPEARRFLQGAALVRTGGEFCSRQDRFSQTSQFSCLGEKPPLGPLVAPSLRVARLERGVGTGRRRARVRKPWRATARRRLLPGSWRRGSPGFVLDPKTRGRIGGWASLCLPQTQRAAPKTCGRIWVWALLGLTGRHLCAGKKSNLASSKGAARQARTEKEGKRRPSAPHHPILGVPPDFPATEVLLWS